MHKSLSTGGKGSIDSEKEEFRGQNLRNHLFKGGQRRGGCHNLGKSKKQIRGNMENTVQRKTFQKGEVLSSIWYFWDTQLDKELKCL